MPDKLPFSFTFSKVCDAQYGYPDEIPSRYIHIKSMNGVPHLILVSLFASAAECILMVQEEKLCVL